MRRRTIILATLFLSITSAGAAEPTLVMGTGPRPLDLPNGAGLLTGGTIRLGLPIGKIEPYGGVGVLYGSGWESEGRNVNGLHISAALGLRWGLGDRELDPFFRTGIWLGYGRGQSARESNTTEVTPVGPFTAHVGFGADAAISQQVDLGLEVGLAGGSAQTGAFFSYQSLDGSSNDQTEQISLSGLFTYSELHIRIHTRKRQ